MHLCQHFSEIVFNWCIYGYQTIFQLIKPWGLQRVWGHRVIPLFARMEMQPNALEVTNNA